MPARAVLLDIAGVLHDGERAYPGAREAVARLRAAGVPLRFVTNTSRRTRAATVEQLTSFGFDLTAPEVFTAPLAGRAYLEARGLRPLLVIHPALAPDFAGLPTEPPNAVFVADAGEHFDYATLDPAFRLLIDGAPLVAVGRNRYFREGGALHLDAGPFVAALEYASGQAAVITGKPAPEFFGAVLADLGASPSAAVMIGDDVEADVQGAVAAGLRGVLVRTGKYREGDEARLPGEGASVAADLAGAVEGLLAG